MAGGLKRIQPARHGNISRNPMTLVSNLNWVLLYRHYEPVRWKLVHVNMAYRDRYISITDIDCNMAKGWVACRGRPDTPQVREAFDSCSGHCSNVIFNATLWATVNPLH
jgi:hypothetical protein